MNPATRRILILILGACVFHAVDAPVRAGSTGDEFFEKEVRPLLVERCVKCHGGDKTRGSLKLTSREAVLQGGDTGPAAVPGKPDDSLLIQLVRRTDKMKMPKGDKLPDREIGVLTRWVEMGLPYPAAAATLTAGFHISDEQRHFWAFEPVKVPPAPQVKDKGWPRSDVDRYILTALEAKGLKPAKPAGKRTLLRRATFDLTGLPPTPEEMDAFLKDDSPDAFAKVVDRLLSSRAYGERWGRHWLDLVRYTDSFDARLKPGDEMDCGDAWRYRDWVIEAFNHDMPYDEFVRNQLAGDLLPSKEGFNRSGIIATSFLALGNWGGGDADKDKLLTDIVDDQVDVTSRTFLGLTVACARCHDHKFDPISQADYYALGGIFFSTHILPNVGPKTNGPPMLRIPLLSPAELAKRNERQQRLADLEKQLKADREKAYQGYAKSQLSETAKYLTASWEYRIALAHSPALPLGDFAAGKKLHAYALRQWIDYLGGGDYQLMMKPIRNVGGKLGVFGWRGEADCPNVLANSTDQEVAIQTFKLPAKSVSVHPGPNNGVAVGWRSPIKGTVSLTGGVTDADPACGDGIAWAIDRRKAGGSRELASGDFANGGAQKFGQGKGATSLRVIEVEPGESIDLMVLPKASHACDTTTVDLTITLTDGSKAWNLAGDVASDLLQNGKGNPHTDRFGNAAVWHFWDMADSRRGQSPSRDAALGAWERVAAGTDRAAVEQAALEYQKAFTITDARSPFWIKSAEDERALPAERRDAIARLDGDINALKKVPAPPIEYANGAEEGGVPGSPHAGVHDVRIHFRGRYDHLGDLVPRRFPEILAGANQKPITSGSGRLQLAEWLTRADNPLTARVMVNRIWQQHFGEGIVSTPSNFGKLGGRPSNLELLDYLADRFVRSGWSIKEMHRLIMLSTTYQQSCENERSNVDPENRLYYHMNRRRLEAEGVRDSLLTVAGRLDRTMGGPSIRDFNIPRRTVYLTTNRSDRSGFRPLFDAADSTAPVDKRTVSTVAPQALFLMNNPFILEQTKALAKRITDGDRDDRARIQRAYRLLYGRPAGDDEVNIGLDFVNRGGGMEKAWQEYCQVLLCANEFVYVD
jgi:Protein of unknown function (DUF1553)/Protein of unknown function (DUF1549)/Planctomycete cytochrome C